GALAAKSVFRLFRSSLVKIPNASAGFPLFPRPAYPWFVTLKKTKTAVPGLVKLDREPLFFYYLFRPAR
ncbi:hypothetical protein, partial [Brevibacillus panacihumi]|uniref:hypothetical protein n=1 Tax=Brevibacillus panacihumi TaxID=497735 RepID=UPI001C831193